MFIHISFVSSVQFNIGVPAARLSPADIRVFGQFLAFLLDDVCSGGGGEVTVTVTQAQIQSYADVAAIRRRMAAIRQGQGRGVDVDGADQGTSFGNWNEIGIGKCLFYTRMALQSRAVELLSVIEVRQ